MKVNEFYPNVFQVDLGMVSCYLINDDGLTLVDTGYAKDRKQLFKAITCIGKKPTDLKQIILTHLHPDHSGLAGYLQDEFTIPVFAHGSDAALLRLGICIREHQVVTPGFRNRLLYLIISLLAPSKVRQVLSITEIENDTVLPILSGARVVYSPGHSKGHIALHFAEEKLLIAGDALVNTDGLKLAPLYEDLMEANASIEKLALLDFDIACFGHGKGISEKASEEFNIFLNSMKTHERSSNS